MNRFVGPLAVVLALVALGLGGCSAIREPSGTRVSVEFPRGEHVSRERIAELSRYLIIRSAGVLGVENARVDAVTDGALVLLLPGKKVSRADAEKLLGSSGLEFYHLSRVATKGHPDRPWHVRVPRRAGMPYLFTGPNATRVESDSDTGSLLKDVVGVPSAKPVFTGDDIEPSASTSQSGSGWAVLVQFSKSGARRFHEFTRDNRGEYLAVFYNRRLVSAPVVDEPIKGGEAFITGFRTRAEAEMAASQLNAGRLPIAVKIASVRYSAGGG